MGRKSFALSQGGGLGTQPFSAHELPEAFHDAMHTLLLHVGKNGKTPISWKTSNTILLYKKGDPLTVKNYRPIALANTIYKLWTSIVTTLMSDFAEEHNILHEGKEGFRRHRNTERQIQMLLGVLEDAKLTKQDIHLLYMDFTNAFGSVDHPRMIALLEDLGFPADCVDIVGNMYTGARTAFITPAGLTGEIPIGRGNIQGDTLSPLIFLCFIEPLLRWLEHDKNLMYTCKTSDTQMGQSAYADDLCVATNSVAHMQAQMEKIKAYEKWAHLEVNVPKCALTAALHATGKNRTIDKETLSNIAQGLKYRDLTLPILGESEPYRYLGVMVTASLEWRHPRTEITSKVAESSLTGSWATKAQQTRSMREVVEA